MSNRWVIPGLFKVFAAFIQWDRERDLLHHEGTTFFQNQPETRTIALDRQPGARPVAPSIPGVFQP